MAMGQESAPPIDEIVWNSPADAINKYQGLHENTILFYFAESPFFDQTSNNGNLFAQALYNPKMSHMIATRKAFESELKTMSGIEYMVAQEPAEMTPGAGTGVWVIRKQRRKKRSGEEDEIQVLATYFVVGFNIYMAPSVGDVLSNRLLSITTSLKNLVETTSSLAKFTPATGHTYLPPRAITRPAAATAPTSREATPAVDNSATSKTLPSPPDPDTTSADARLLTESFTNSLRYGDVYMDENPITGQPGDFHFSSTGRVEKDKLLMPLPVAKQPFASQTPKKPTDSQPSLGIKTKDLPSRKGSRAEKSPRTPGGSKPKRRKSKGATAVSTPQGARSPA